MWLLNVQGQQFNKTLRQHQVAFLTKLLHGHAGHINEINIQFVKHFSAIPYYLGSETCSTCVHRFAAVVSE